MRCESRKSLGFFRQRVNDLLKVQNHVSRDKPFKELLRKTPESAKVLMSNEVIHGERKTNRKLLIWFLVALFIALLPWLVLGAA